MEIQVLLIIVLIVAIIAVLAVYLLATIAQLVKINSGLSVVLPLVGQIITKTEPVNPVVDDINQNLVTTRDALENLMWKKAGPDAPGIVESLFPGEGQNFLRRTGRTGRVVNCGAVYTRGVGILAALGRGAPIGAAHEKGPAVRDPRYQTTEVAKLYPAPPRRRDPTQTIPKSPVVGKDPVHSPYEPASTPGTRPRPRPRTPQAPTGRLDAAPAPAPAAAPPPDPAPGPSSPRHEPPSAPGRLSAKGSRPWEH